MADVRVRDLDDRVIAELKAQAKRHGKTFGEELRGLLTEAAWRPRREMVAELREHQEQMRAKYGVLPDSTPLIREERDRWG
jgi:plasmid stability protein